MKIGIIVAMEKELNLLLPLIHDVSIVTLNDFRFHCGTLNGHDIIAMQCGIGKVNAAVGTLTLIENFHPALVINTGVAGGTGNASILDVVVGSEIAYHDCWCGPGTQWGAAAGCPDRFQSLETLVNLPLFDGNPKVKHGLIASGDIFVSKKGEVDHVLRLYPDALAVDMESASIAQVCYLKNVPVFIMRVISDTPGGEDNIAQYENFWSDAPKATFNLLKELINQL